MEKLQACRSLTSLDIQFTTVTDVGLKFVGLLSNLTNLGLSFNSRVTEAGLLTLAGLRRLARLNCSPCSNLFSPDDPRTAILFNLFNATLTSLNVTKLTA